MTQAKDLQPGARFYFLTGVAARRVFTAVSVTTTDAVQAPSIYGAKDKPACTTIKCAATVFNVAPDTNVEVVE